MKEVIRARIDERIKEEAAAVLDCVTQVPWSGGSYL